MSQLPAVSRGYRGYMPHLKVYTHCGACNRPVRLRDVLVAIHFRLFSTFEGAIRKIPRFKRGELVKQGKSAEFCKDVDCGRCCTNKFGAATFHADCFHLFNKYCGAEDKYARLWFAARRMFPTRNGTCFKDLYDPTVAQQLNTVFDLVGLKMVPLSLTRDIWNMIPTSHIVARFCSVLQLAAEMDSAPTVPSICPLSEVLFWTRGQYHTVQKDIGNELPFVRFTLDSRGFKKLERVKTASLSISATEAYSIMPASKVASMGADFRFGLCHLMQLTPDNGG